MPSDRDEAKPCWQDGVPVSACFADGYRARGDGLAEKRHVFGGQSPAAALARALGAGGDAGCPLDGRRAVPLPPGLWLELVVADARAAVPLWQGAAGAGFLDGSAPAPGIVGAGAARATHARTARQAR